MFFLFYKFLFFISDFLEIQRKSFYKFLNFQLGYQLSKIPFLSLSQASSRKSKERLFPYPSFQRISIPNFSYRSLLQIKKMLPKKSFLKNHQKSLSEDIKICFVYKHFRYSQPLFNIEESILLSKTYCCHFYVPIQLSFSSTNHLTQWIFLGTLPLLTRRGHFIINGTPRVVINQIVRSPGIYFHRDTRFFYTEIISERGPWIRLEIDKKKKIWVSLTSQQSGLTRMDFSFFFQNYYPKYKYIDLLDSQKNITALKDSRKRKRKRKSRNESFAFFTVSQLDSLRGLLKKRFQISSKFRFFNFGLFIKCRKSFKRFPKHVIHLNVFHQSRKLPKSKQKGALDQNLNVPSSSKNADLSFPLGENGRFRLNQKLGLSLKTLSLTPLDFLTLRNLLLKLHNNQKNLLFDDIDHLKNRKFKTIGDLLQNQLAIGLQRLQKLFENKKFPSSINFLRKKKISSPLREKHFPSTIQKSKKSKKSKTVSKKEKVLSLLVFSLLNNQPINSVFKEFFHSHQLSQYLDQSNPLAEITHKRRLSCLGSGGINRETAGMEIRGIHPSHYGRICPIETPEGKNAGLVNSLTNMAKIYPNGLMKTPYTEVYKQHEQNQRKLVFFSIENQENQNIFFSRKLPKFKNISVSTLKILNFQKCRCHSINFIAFHPQQFLSIATTCIPFIEHDDANRALMGSNMQRQALPLLSCEHPYVTTWNAFRVLSDLKDIPTSSMSGIVLYISQQKICFYFPLTIWQKKNISIPPCLYCHFFQEFQQNFRHFQIVVPLISLLKLKKQMQQNIRFFKFNVPLDFH
uniref:DNA-directed RNA polymerase n=1 Tax=Johnson-sea-linkia profunda TaxID=575876 RepID=A0A386AXU0_9CHLO|nr:RNA polymerase b-subunit [Johnson-sea-linkia profunda]